MKHGAHRFRQKANCRKGGLKFSQQSLCYKAVQSAHISFEKAHIHNEFRKKLGEKLLIAPPFHTTT